MKHVLPLLAIVFLALGPASSASAAASVTNRPVSHTSGPNVVWKSTATDSKHDRVLPTISQSVLAEVIEDLMAQPPNQGR
jgi:hypothetical protein